MNVKRFHSFLQTNRKRLGHLKDFIHFCRPRVKGGSTHTLGGLGPCEIHVQDGSNVTALACFLSF